MTETDSVHGTPPLSSSLIQEEGLSRRLILAGLAMAGFPTAAQTITAEHDPVFGLIAEWRAADIAHGVAIDAQDRADERCGFNSPEANEADAAAEKACHAAADAIRRLARTPPTTMACVVAVLRFANEVEAEELWPDYDDDGGSCHCRLRATLAQAIEAIKKTERRAES